jgi:hypothetical protein
MMRIVCTGFPNRKYCPQYGDCSMDAVCNIIRKKLCRLGWKPRQRAIETAGGDKVWVVFSNQASRSFSIQACTQQDAWESAWRLVGKYRQSPAEPQMILPFPVSVPSFHRAA